MRSAVPIEHCSRVLHAGIQTRDRRSQDLLKIIGLWRRLAEQRSLRKNRKTIDPGTRVSIQMLKATLSFQERDVFRAGASEPSKDIGALGGK